jgi:ribose transport system ATP-binding protein
MEKNIVELSQVTKYFPGVIALKNISMKIKKGEVHGLIGENGAGKSTIIKALTGVHCPEEGDIFLEGEKVVFKNPHQAMEAGIGCVYQELNIVPEMSITDNLFLSSPIRNKMGLLDYRYMHKRAAEVMNSLGLDIDPKTQCGSLGMGIQQMVEIGKSILHKVKFLIMDEPSSSLGEAEVKQMMKTIRRLKSEGITILFVSHKLEELFEICDTVTVMRDGEWVSTTPVSELTNDKLITDMVGRSLENLFPKELGKKGEEFLSVENLTYHGVFQNINFKAYGGQVLGFSGLVGSGRSELFQSLFGAMPKDGGKVYIKGEEKKINTPTQAIAEGIGFITEDRKGQGLVLDQAVVTNLNLATTKVNCKGFFVNDEAIGKMALKNVEALKIKTPDLDTSVGTLSGGNQQKVVIGKWINTNAEIYIFDEPTRGIDVGAKIEVYNTMNNIVKEGKCVIMISSELPEVLGMSDSVIVMREGTIRGQIDRNDKHFNQEDIMKLAWGGTL